MSQAVSAPVLQLTLERFVPKSLNEQLRMNRYRLHRYKKMWEKAIWGKVNEAGGPGWERPPLKGARVQMTIYFPHFRRRDADNYAGFKAIMDGLQAAGVLADDNATDVRWETPILMVDPPAPRTLIEVYESD